jgi:hypothetical protein
MHEVAVRVAENLHFHVPGAGDELLEVHLVLAERRLRLAPRRGDGLGETALVLDDAHAAAASSPARLQHHRKAHLARELERARLVVGQRRRRRHHRHAGARREIARGDLVAQPAHGVGQRADENDARRRTGLGELGTLGQEPVSRVNRVDARLDGDAHDVLDVEIRLDRALALADEIAFVGLGPMQREAVLARMNGHGANAELGGGAHHADGDLAAIRDEHALDRGRLEEWLHLLLMIALARTSGQRRHSMFGLAIHGGAGTLPRAEMSAESEALYRAGLSEALAAGFAVLESRRLEPRGGDARRGRARGLSAVQRGPRRRIHPRRTERARRLHHGRHDAQGRGGLRPRSREESHRARARGDGAFRVRHARRAPARRSSPSPAGSRSCRAATSTPRRAGASSSASAPATRAVALDDLAPGHGRGGGRGRGGSTGRRHLDRRHDRQALRAHRRFAHHRRGYLCGRPRLRRIGHRTRRGVHSPGRRPRHLRARPLRGAPSPRPCAKSCSRSSPRKAARAAS